MASLAAILAGDIPNAVLAETPGGIERQEAQGQADMVEAADRLPIEINERGITHADIEKNMGIKFGPKVDGLFLSATLPAGWSIQPTDHSMWSNLLDDKGRTRASIFYKAAFYDRNAHIDITPRYSLDSEHHTDGSVTYHVKDNATKARIYTAGTGGAKQWEQRDDIRNTARQWLTANYPDHANPFAYWD